MATIEHYTFGRMRVDGEEFTDDVTIIDGKAKGGWWRDRGHLLQPGDLDEVLAADPEVLVIGTGDSGNMRVDDSVRSLLREKNVTLIAKPTAEALQEFNDLSAKGADVAGGFHLTC